MAIYQTAHYQIRPEAVEKVTTAIKKFVSYVRDQEPGTVMYRAWQQADDPTRFVHLFEFRDEAAQQLHGQSAAVREFEASYRPELIDGPVQFVDYLQVDTN